MPHPRLIAAALLAAGLTALLACAPAASTPTAAPPTSTSTPVPSPTVTLTPTPPACLTAPGSVTQHALQNGNPPQEFVIYLPPCYDYDSETRYPVIYLLHGQTFRDDQWINLGAPQAADNLIHSGQAEPFIMVFPDDRYWNLPPGNTFGDRLIYEIIPFVDANYRTRAERHSRALGGLSRGGGWAIHYTLTRYDLFGMIGLHSPVIFNDDAAVLERLIVAVPVDAWPRLWLDSGDRDSDLGPTRRFEDLLTTYAVPHEWHIFLGDHTEAYWRAHVAEYLEWYANGFRELGAPVPTITPTP